MRCGMILTGLIALTLGSLPALAQKETSGNGSKLVKVNVRNSLDQPVKVLWVDGMGDEVDYGKLEAGASVDMETYNTHLWRFKVGDKVVGTFRAGNAGQQTYELKKGPAGRVDPKMPKPDPGRNPVVGNSGSALTAKEAEDVVAYHNKVRRDVGVDPVVWSATLAKFAQEWADKLAANGDFEHRPRQGQWAQKYGENLAINATVQKGAEAWYNEISDYRAGTPIPNNFGAFKAGHYTQMVWSKTKSIGVGKAIIKNGRFKGQIVIVANYDPPGNYLGEKPY